MPFVGKGENGGNQCFLLCQETSSVITFEFVIAPQTKFGRGGYTGVTCPPIRLCVTKSCPGHNFKSIKASNFKLHTQIGHIVEKYNVQEP